MLPAALLAGIDGATEAATLVDAAALTATAPDSDGLGTGALALADTTGELSTITLDDGKGAVLDAPNADTVGAIEATLETVGFVLATKATEGVESACAGSVDGATTSCGGSADGFVATPDGSIDGDIAGFVGSMEGVTVACLGSTLDETRSDWGSAALISGSGEICRTVTGRASDRPRKTKMRSDLLVSIDMAMGRRPSPHSGESRSQLLNRSVTELNAFERVC